MSMEITTILEMIQVFLAYAFLVLLAPYIVLKARLRNRTLHQKFIICVLVGNFYMVNVVFIMFILHIPSRISLYILSIVPAAIAWYKINHPDVKGFFLGIYTSVTRLFLDEVKIGTLWLNLTTEPKKRMKAAIRGCFSHIFHHILEWGMLSGLVAFNVYYYGYQTFVRYSYGTSDMVVHHYWVNQIAEGNIFCNGIYPFGFHNVLYFIHDFFGIQILSIFRVFGMIETLYIYAMIYVLLRKICRSRYIPIIGVLIFTLPNLFETQSIMRYQFTLPQEFGMIFLYPCAYFLMQFFQQKKEEIAIEKELRRQNKLYTWLALYHLRPSTWSLILFAISFSLTLSAHFYITIVAVFLCFAVAMAYFPVVFHYRYFCSIAVAGILSLSSAIAPMAVFFVGGTPLQGSLGWALGVISSSSEKAEAPEEDKKLEKYKVNEGDGFVVYDITDAPASLLDPSASAPPSVTAEQPTPQPQPSLLERVEMAAKSMQKRIVSFNDKVAANINSVYIQEDFITFLLYGMEGMMAACALLTLIRRKFYYRNLLSIALYLFFMVMLYSSADFSMPSPMDQNRSRIFVAYAAPVFCGVLLDLGYVILFRPLRYHRLTELFPIAAGVAMTFLIITQDFIKPLSMEFAIQSTGEMYCNYEIMKNYPDKKWTIVSSTDSLQLVLHKGWHQEACTFLGKMHNMNADTTVTIPTKYVFFYIEKYPLQYGVANNVTDDFLNLGYVSEEDAAMPAVYNGSEAYGIENRKTLESKLFFWAKAFEEKYPQEFQVYYENETFICYRIIQNEFNLYNFAIDYTYN